MKPSATPIPNVRRIAPWLLAAATVAIVAAAVAWLTQAAEPDRLRRSIDAALQSGQTDQARALVDRWRARSPDAPEALIAEARVLVAENRPADALASLDRARALGAAPERLDRDLGILYARAGRLAEAEQRLLRSVAADPAPDPPRDEALIRLYIGSFRLADAGAQIERWATAAPRDARPFLWLGEMHRANGNSRRLPAAYRAALERDPNCDEARLRLAEVLPAEGDTVEALRLCEEYLSRHPDDPAALVIAGRIALEDAQTDRARAWLERAVDAGSTDPRAFEALAQIALRGGDGPERALAWLDRAVEADPYDPGLRSLRASTLARLGRSDEASAARDEAARLSAEQKTLHNLRRQMLRAPRDPGPALEAARWLLDHGGTDEAVEIARRAFAMPGGRADAARLLADHYAAAGNSGLANFYRLEANRPAP
jgi:tetratricopeptide (TPR) repeat protein